MVHINVTVDNNCSYFVPFCKDHNEIERLHEIVFRFATYFKMVLL